MTWQSPSGEITIGRPSEGLAEPMSPPMAASAVDQWFPSSSQRALWTLQEIATALGERFHPSGNDVRELQEILRRALYSGNLVAVERRDVAFSSPELPPPPPPAPSLPAPPTDEKAAIRFRVVLRGSFEPVVHAKVRIRFSDGHEEQRETDAMGQVFLFGRHGEVFTVTAIEEPFDVARVKRS